MGLTKQTSAELKTRVNRCLNKLSDRDTLSMAANELESVARGLPNDAFVPFLNCLSATDSSEKSPVRRQCVRLLSVLSAAHGDALSPHLSRMISAVLRRIRDPDSAVQEACFDAVSSISTHVNSPPFAVILKPLVDALFHEQDVNAQIGASLCLSAAVEAAPEPDAAELRELMPRVLKLVKSDCSKFLSSEDWAARKAAAEVLKKVAVAERTLAAEFRSSCLAALESRRFDKVKIVRERMNRALAMWKDLPGLFEDIPSPKDTSSGGQSPVQLSKSLGPPGNVGLEIPQSRKMVPARSTPSSCSENLDMADRHVVKDDFENQKEFGDISVIRKQLLQIENQQSNLLDLLQKFIGSSQMGMHYLEKRVDGLEKVLDEMSKDFGISSRGRISGTDNNTCCMIPGAEFLSPRFWRKAEGHTVSSKF
ncbi:hypothetical protein OROHE_019280 [Orobanche hederae]